MYKLELCNVLELNDLLHMINREKYSVIAVTQYGNLYTVIYKES